MNNSNNRRKGCRVRITLVAFTFARVLTAELDRSFCKTLACPREELENKSRATNLILWIIIYRPILPRRHRIFFESTWFIIPTQFKGNKPKNVFNRKRNSRQFRSSILRFVMYRLTERRDRTTERWSIDKREAGSNVTSLQTFLKTWRNSSNGLR